MLKDPRNLLWLVPFAALLTMPFWKPFAADFLNPVRQETGSSPPSITGTHNLTSSEMRGIEFQQSRNGTKEWLLTASRLYSLANDSDLQFEDVRASFYGSGRDDKETRIRSQKAQYIGAAKQIILQGGVLIENDKGLEVQTESLEYLAAQKKIRTTSAVKIQGNNIEITGRQLLYDTVTGNYSISGDVVCMIW